MSESQKTESVKKPVPVQEPLPNVKSMFSNDAINQEVKTIVNQGGIYVHGANEPYEYEGKKGMSAWIQVMHVARDDSSKQTLTTIKVDQDNVGLIDILNRSIELKRVTLQCELRMFGKQSQLILTAEQPHLDFKVN